MPKALAPAPAPTPVRRIRFGGEPYVLRPLRLGDEPALIEFFRSHAPDTVYQRYGYQVADMTPARAAQLVNVDQERDRALGIFEPSPAGEVLHAVGRYCLDPDGARAETAFVVRESKRNLGMATALLRELGRTASRRGLAALWAQVSPDNAPMLQVFRRQGFARVPSYEAGMARVVLDLRRPT
jgi:GNAT superfamily N-acetyltransferase